jgi:hypothetical protein
MNTIPVTKEEVLEDFPIVEQWLTNIKDYLKKDIDENKIQFFYTFGFFVPKTNNKEDLYMKMYEDCSKMMFNDRLKFELSKVRVSLSIKSGNFMMADRLPKGNIPKIVEDIVGEITKVKMIVEADYHNDKEITDSIPDINRDIVSFDLIKDYVKEEVEVEFDLDTILDKISNDGFDSLSDEEKEFLDQKSKDM